MGKVGRTLRERERVPRAARGWVIGFIRDPADTAGDLRMYLIALYLHWTVTT